MQKEKNIIQFQIARNDNKRSRSISRSFRPVYSLLNSQDFDAARDLIIKLNFPNHYLTHAYTGDAYRFQGNFQEAISSYSRAIKCAPDCAYLLLLRGICFREIGYLENSIIDFTNGIKLTPDDSDFFYQKGVSFSAMGHNNAALTSFNSAIGITPSCVHAIASRGHCKKKAEDFDGALKDYNHCVKLQPKTIWLREVRGTFLQNTERYEAALRDLKYVLSHSEGVAITHSQIAFCLGELGKTDESFKHFTTATLISPTNTTNIYWFGMNLLKARHIEQSIACFERILELDHWDHHCAFQLVNIYSDATNKASLNLDRAYHLAQMINNKFDYDDAIYLALLGKIEALRCNYKEAIKWTQKAIILASRDDTNDYHERIHQYRLMGNILG